jgi:hypothetical protein
MGDAKGGQYELKFQRVVEQSNDRRRRCDAVQQPKCQKDKPRGRSFQEEPWDGETLLAVQGVRESSAPAVAMRG